MQVKTLYEDADMVIKEIRIGGRFIYKHIYILDPEGYVAQDSRIYADGTIENN